MTLSDGVMKIWLVLAALLGGLMGTVEVKAEGNDAGQALYQKTCKNCHGKTAKGLASYPKLTGHPVDYLTDKLERYRAGEKIGPNSPLMIPHAKRLTDEDIANIAGYITTTFD